MRLGKICLHDMFITPIIALPLHTHTKLDEVFAGKKSLYHNSGLLVSYLSVLSLIDLGGELEAREGVAGGQLVVEWQQAVRMQSDGACWREVVHVGIQSAIMADGGA